MRKYCGIGQSSEGNRACSSGIVHTGTSRRGKSAYTVIQFLEILQLTSNLDKHLRIKKNLR